MKKGMKKIIVALLMSLVLTIGSASPVMAATDTNKTTTVKKQKTSKAYKKYVGTWKSVNYKIKIKVINKGYLKATITEKSGDTVTIDQKMNVKKKKTLNLVSKKGQNVKVIIKLKYGKRYSAYGGKYYRDGPRIYLEGTNRAWSRSAYGIIKNGKRVPAMLVYSKVVK